MKYIGPLEQGETTTQAGFKRVGDLPSTKVEAKDPLGYMPEEHPLRQMLNLVPVQKNSSFDALNMDLSKLGKPLESMSKLIPTGEDIKRYAEDVATGWGIIKDNPASISGAVNDTLYNATMVPTKAAGGLIGFAGQATKSPLISKVGEWISAARPKEAPMADQFTEAFFSPVSSAFTLKDTVIDESPLEPGAKEYVQEATDLGALMFPLIKGAPPMRSMRPMKEAPTLKTTMEDLKPKDVDSIIQDMEKVIQVPEQAPPMTGVKEQWNYPTGMEGELAKAREQSEARIKNPSMDNVDLFGVKPIKPTFTKVSELDTQMNPLDPAQARIQDVLGQYDTQVGLIARDMQRRPEAFESPQGFMERVRTDADTLKQEMPDRIEDIDSHVTRIQAGLDWQTKGSDVALGQIGLPLYDKVEGPKVPEIIEPIKRDRYANPETFYNSSDGQGALLTPKEIQQSYESYKAPVDWENMPKEQPNPKDVYIDLKKPDQSSLRYPYKLDEQGSKLSPETRARYKVALEANKDSAIPGALFHITQHTKSAKELAESGVKVGVTNIYEDGKPRGLYFAKNPEKLIQYEEGGDGNIKLSTQRRYDSSQGNILDLPQDIVRGVVNVTPDKVWTVKEKDLANQYHQWVERNNLQISDYTTLDKWEKHLQDNFDALHVYGMAEPFRGDEYIVLNDKVTQLFHKDTARNAPEIPKELTSQKEFKIAEDGSVLSEPTLVGGKWTMDQYQGMLKELKDNEGSVKGVNAQNIESMLEQAKKAKAKEIALMESKAKLVKERNEDVKDSNEVGGDEISWDPWAEKDKSDSVFTEDGTSLYSGLNPEAIKKLFGIQDKPTQSNVKIVERPGSFLSKLHWIISPEQWAKTNPEGQKVYRNLVEKSQEATYHIQEAMDKVDVLKKDLSGKDMELVTANLKNSKFPLSPKLKERVQGIKDLYAGIRHNILKPYYDWKILEAGTVKEKALLQDEWDTIDVIGNRYTTFMEPGNYKIMAEGKTVAYAKTRKRAIEKADQLAIEKADSGIDFTITQGELFDTSGTGEKFAASLQEKKNILKGEKNVFDVLPSYVRELHMKSLLDPIINDFKKVQTSMPTSMQHAFKELFKDVKGRKGVMDKVVDGLLDKAGILDEPMAYSRAIGHFRQGQGYLKLGYRPIAAVINRLSGVQHTFVKTGAGYIVKARSFLGTEAGKKFIQEEKVHMGMSFAEESGKLKSNSSVLNPMKMFQAMEPINRSESMVANYLMAKDKYNMLEKEAREYARQAVRFQQFTYDIASLPKIMRGPTGKLITQFKPYLLKEIEFIASLKGGEVPRYMGSQIALGGPRALVYVLKSLPVLGALGVLGDLDEWASTNASRAYRGVGGMLGLDATAPFAFQFPKTVEDWMGPTLSDIASIKKNLLDPWIRDEIIGPKDVKKTAKDLSPVFNTWGTMVDSIIDNDSWVRDDKGKKLYQATTWDKVKLFGGATPLEESHRRIVESNINREEKLDRVNKEKITSMIVDRLRDGKEVPSKYWDKAVSLGVSADSIIGNYEGRLNTPFERRINTLPLEKKTKALRLLPKGD